MSFFIKNKSGKRKRTQQKVGSRQGSDKPGDSEPFARRGRKYRGPTEEIVSDSDEGEGVASRRDDVSSSEEEETVQEKKLRLTKQYLAQIAAEERDKHAEEETDADMVSHRLTQDLLEQAGKLQKKVADTLQPPSVEDITVLRGHQLSITCVVISPDSQYVYSCSKDCSIIKWSVRERRKVGVVRRGKKGAEGAQPGHTAKVLCIAISSDGKYLASGDMNKLIHVWDPDTLVHLHTFRGHRDAISGLAFRKDTHQLFSCSHDRSVKIWNTHEKTYVETLFGHQNSITAIDSLVRERAITAGGRDGSVRIWKIIEESQLVFHGNMCSVDCVALLNESYFVSGADDNSLCLWSVMKKKPLVTVKNAHGGDSDDPKSGEENWITALAALHNTDVVASGSKDGSIRLWKCSADYRKLQPLFTIPTVGFVNSLKFSPDGKLLVAGVGQEHRLGRWWQKAEARNSICVIPLMAKLP